MKLNKEQEAYFLAKANVAALEEMESEAEAEYCKALGVVNDDGSIPTKTWAIDDDEIANRAIDEFGTIMNDSELWKKILAAKEELEKAEDDLIRYALSIFPFPEKREILAREAKTNIKIRTKLLDMASRLDVSTVTMDSV